MSEDRMRSSNPPKVMTRSELVEYLRSDASKAKFDEVRKKTDRMVESYRRAETLTGAELDVRVTL